MSREIAVDEVLAFAVASDGTAFRMSVRGKTGEVVGLAFPTDAVKTLMLGLSRVADEALTRMLRDDSARLIHSVERLTLQPAPATDQLILSIRTHDGLEAAFAIAPEALERIAQSASDLTRRSPDQPVQIN